MQRYLPSVRETAARAEHPQNERTSVTGISGNPERRELSLCSVMDAIPGLLWSALPDGTVEFCNQRWLDYTGMSLDEVHRSGWTATIHPQDLTDLQERWLAALTRSTPFATEARMRGVDGSYRWFLVQAVPLRGAGGAIVRWYGTNTDIEDRKQAEQEVQKQACRLDELF